MHASQVRSAVGAASAIASDLSLSVEDWQVLHNSNRIAVRLLPCDVLVRVAPAGHHGHAELELEVVRRLAERGSPVAGLQANVAPSTYVRDGFVVTFWTYYEPASPPDVAPVEYARSLDRLHAGLRELHLPVPHFTERVAEAQLLVGDRALTPDLGDADRDFLSSLLRTLKSSVSRRAGVEQLLHGEPHPGNLLRTKDGPLFIDFETCCRGPVEFDVAGAPEEVGEDYSGLDGVLLGECRMLALGLVAAWRWDRDDQLPNGRRMGTELILQLREEAQRRGLDAVP